MKTETRSLQLWPVGTSVTVSGAGDDLRIWNHDKRGRQYSRKATPAEVTAIRIEELARMYADRDILCCDSSLVGELIQEAYNSRSDLASAFSDEEIQGRFVDPSDWSLEQCREYLDDNNATFPDPDPWGMDRDALIETLLDNWDSGEELTDEKRAEFDGSTDDVIRENLIREFNEEHIDGLDDWRTAVREHSQDNPQEAYEWYRVTPWLRARLEGIGEITIDNSYGDWWGRGGTGQSLLMDGTLQRIAANFV